MSISGTGPSGQSAHRRNLLRMIGNWIVSTRPREIVLQKKCANRCAKLNGRGLRSETPAKRWWTASVVCATFILEELRGAPFANDSLTVQEPSQPLTPPTVIDRIPPEYPLAARLQRQEGFVLVEFTVAKDGTVSNPTVLGANPQGIFDEAALQAVHQWRYQPTVIGGVPVERPGMRVEIDFKLNG
jgi:TonB family protein